MKKEYMKPTIEVIMMEQEATILTGSLPLSNEEVNGGWAPELSEDDTEISDFSF